MATIKQLAKDGENTLTESVSARLDAELLLAFAVEKSRTWLYTWPQHIPSLPEQQLYLELLRRRKEGEPVAYLTGSRDFWDLELIITDNVLIPRPETELLVETALDRLSAQDKASVADLGTGSGAIALALASEKPCWEIIATDNSAESLDLARRNAEILSLKNVQFMAGDWLAPLQDMSFDAILSNPPYIEPNDPHLQQGDVRFEPEYALVSAEKGLADLKTIVKQAQPFLVTDGYLILEHGHQQGERVRQLLSRFHYTEIETIKDLSGLERVTLGRNNRD